MVMTLRKLTENEVKILKSQSCTADDWNAISVKAQFRTETVRNVNFYGNIRIGKLGGKKALRGGSEIECGIYNSHLSHCKVGDNCLIINVANLANYNISDDTVIDNCNSIVTEGVSGFGNGVELDVLNEGGGRTLPIFDCLSAQLAYLLVNYRHNQKFIECLLTMIAEYCDTKKSQRGFIGAGSVIRHSGIIRNVRFGENSLIENVTRLEEGTVGSNREAPVYIGDAVIAKEFIIQSGTKIDGGALLDRCFVGQSVKIGKQYSAENSAFFCNCEGFHGEACSIFAGPYSVTHHKSTLLIAGLFSFYNAGSGTNQSNHMYKLGPVHQGILERGSKTGSFSYLLWPSRVGAYSVVTGKHTANFDASDFPFSYITEENGRTQLTPAMNLFTVGTRRDSAKWLTRDKRTDPEKHDLIHFNLFNPYTVGKMVRAKALLEELSENTSKEQEFIHYKGCYIKRLLLRTCAKYYDMAIKIYIGNELIRRVGNAGSVAELKNQIFEVNPKSGKWIDLAGMLVEKSTLSDLIDRVTDQQIDSVRSLTASLRNIYNNYAKQSWKWTCGLIAQRFGKDISEIGNAEIGRIIFDWESAGIKFNNMILKDAAKEFDQNARIAYGIDCEDEDTILADFTAVRGNYESNSFVKELQLENESIAITARELLSKFEITNSG